MHYAGITVLRISPDGCIPFCYAVNCIQNTAYDKHVSSSVMFDAYIPSVLNF